MTTVLEVRLVGSQFEQVEERAMSLGTFSLVTRYYWKSFTRQIRSWLSLSPAKRKSRPKAAKLSVEQ
jgi:hypothetical protein